MRELYIDIGAVELNDPNMGAKLAKAAKAHPDAFFVLSDPRRRSVYDATLSALRVTRYLRKQLGLTSTSMAKKIMSSSRASVRGRHEPNADGSA